MYWASASLAGNFPASQSSEYCLLSAAASHRRKSCNSPIASFLISSRVRWEGKLRDIFAAPSSPRFILDGNKEQLIGWEANDEIPRKRMLLVKRSVSEQGNRGVRLLPSNPMVVMHRISARVGAYSCRTTLRREESTWRPSLLYLMKPSFLNLFMKKFTRGRVVPIISASSSCDTLGSIFCGWASLP